MLTFWRTGRLSPLLVLRLSLFALPLIDEVVSGIPVLTLPLIRDDLQLSYTEAGLLFSVPELAGLLVEPGVNAASDLWPKHRLIIGSLLIMIVGWAVAAGSPTFFWLLCAFILIGATNGIALGMGQASLIDQEPKRSIQTMTRWALMATAGDLLGPLLVAAAISVQIGWRPLFWAGATLWLLGVLALLPQRFPAPQVHATESDEPGGWRAIRANLVEGLRTPGLIRWIFIKEVPTLLDEMFLGFAGLFLLDVLALPPAWISLALGLEIAGAMVGLLLLERVGRRHSPSEVLVVVIVLVLAGLLLLITAPNAAQAIAGLILVGTGAGAWYPLASGAAYAALPGRSGTVRALSSLSVPFVIAAPIIIGMISERWGIQVGLGMLMLGPLAALLLRPRHKKATGAE